jgi:nucleotide-binding universal stress UspA family protein
MNSTVNNQQKATLQLLGIGSSDDRALLRNVQQALQQLSIYMAIEEIRDIDAMLEYGISGIPALLVNNKVIFQKVVPSVEDIRIVLSVLLGKQEEAQSSYRRILVPTDFSAASINAFRYACELAVPLQSHVHLMHIHQPPIDMGGAVMARKAPVVVRGKEEQLEQIMDVQQELSPNARKVAVTSEVIVGFAVDELRRASARETDLMVMGMTGDNGILEKWLGTTATELSRQAACPVLLIPSKYQYSPPGEIVYASAYAPGEEQLLPSVLGFANQFEATLHFVHIEEVKSRPTSTYSVQKVPVFLPHEDHQVKLQLSTVNSKDVLTGLEKYSSDHESDLLVMATPRRSAIGDFFHRSTTRKMILQTATPLLIMHYERD